MLKLDTVVIPIYPTKHINNEVTNVANIVPKIAYTIILPKC